MRILIVPPSSQHTLAGNRITAQRWARLFTELGHQPEITTDYQGRPSDLLIALHARKTAPAIGQFRQNHPKIPIILALTGTDLYGDIHEKPAAQKSLEQATHLILLQPDGLNQLSPAHRQKASVIYQSVEKLESPPPPRTDRFQVCVVGHLRPVKDPFRAAWAARRLHPASRIQIVHLGAALTDEMERQAQRETQENPRYEWLGAVPYLRSRCRLASSRLMVHSSYQEGGANALSEALADSVPVISSRISGSIGLLGEDYPGYFTPGSTEELTALLRRTEEDQDIYALLKTRCEQLREKISPQREKESWQKLLQKFSPDHS